MKKIKNQIHSYLEHSGKGRKGWKGGTEFGMRNADGKGRMEGRGGN